MEINNDTDITWISPLLPMREAVITLQCLRPAKARFFHQPALYAFLRHFLSKGAPFDDYLTIDTAESGRIEYKTGDYYRFSLICFAGGEDYLSSIFAQLKRMPLNAPRTGEKCLFTDNWRFISCHDGFTEEPITDTDALSAWGMQSLEEETQLWLDQQTFSWQWLSPARLLKAKDQQTEANTGKKLKGEARFCHNENDINSDLLLSRLFDTLTGILRRRKLRAPSRPTPPDLAIQQAHCIWLDADYSDQQKQTHIMGGMSGVIQWQIPQPLSAYWWALLVLGQYVGIGQRRSFGWGRYRLLNEDQGFSYRRIFPAHSLLQQAALPNNLQQALDNTRSNFKHEVWQQLLNQEATQLTPDQIPMDIAPLQSAFEKMMSGQYEAPALQGRFLEKPDTSARLLAVPPVFDRILQRAVAQVLTPAVEQLFYARSYGYRPGRSRQHARYDIQKAYRDGYRWVYESDIDDFFDAVTWERLLIRLQALFGDDPLVTMMMNWIQRDLIFQESEFKGQRLQRRMGLPQGSPLSPLLANIMLDDFDSDMEKAGFKLIRFADDFVVLCKHKEEAQLAAQLAKQSLSEHGLSLNDDKTRIVSMDQGFKYLGYLFVNDLVVETKKKKQSLRNDTAQLNPDIWLAALSDKSISALGLDGYHKKTVEDTNETDSNKSTALKIGERQEQGALFCVTGSTSVISTDNERLQCRRDEKIITDIPWRQLQSVILFGRHHLTTPAMKAALRFKVPIHMASQQGHYEGCLWHGEPVSGSGLWLKQQAFALAEDKALHFSRNLMHARLRHIKETVRRQGGDVELLNKALSQLEEADSLASLNGIEGAATRCLFQLIQDKLPEQWGFSGRNRRPPRDPFNVLLSVGYTLLYGVTDTVLRADGLLPWQGIYHQSRGTHAALASDLMEPFRHVIERAALAVVNKGQITTDDFYGNDKGCHINKEAYRRYIAYLIGRFESTSKAVGDDNAVSIFEHLHQQNLSLKRWLQEEVADFIVRKTR